MNCNYPETSLYPHTIKQRVQNTLLRMAVEVHQICKNANIQCSIAQNALVGAVLYQDFIPWDDTFDFWIPEKDYSHAIDILRQRLPSWIFVQDVSSEPGYSAKWAMLRDVHSEAHTFYYSLKDVRKKTNYTHNGIAINLFPLSESSPQNLRYSKFQFSSSDFFPLKEYTFANHQFLGPKNPEPILSTIYYKNGGYDKVNYFRNRKGQYKYVQFDDMPIISATDEIDFRFEIHWTEHCNLNCKACGHYSPIAEEEYIDPVVYRRDLQALRKVLGDRIDRINLMGGEPLLHPQIIDLCKISSEELPHTFLNLITNGLLLKSMPPEFWETCHQYEISIGLSKYPISLDYSQFFPIARNYGVDLFYYHIVNPRFKVFTLDPTGKQDIIANFPYCVAPSGIQIKNGRLYRCPPAAYFSHVNKFFHYSMTEEKEDYLVISEIRNPDEIIEYLSVPSPFCRFCDMKSKYGIDWGLSKKEKSEWIL